MLQCTVLAVVLTISVLNALPVEDGAFEKDEGHDAILEMITSEGVRATRISTALSHLDADTRDEIMAAVELAISSSAKPKPVPQVMSSSARPGEELIQGDSKTQHPIYRTPQEVESAHKTSTKIRNAVADLSADTQDAIIAAIEERLKRDKSCNDFCPACSTYGIDECTKDPSWALSWCKKTCKSSDECADPICYDDDWKFCRLEGIDQCDQASVREKCKVTCGVCNGCTNDGFDPNAGAKLACCAGLKKTKEPRVPGDAGYGTYANKIVCRGDESLISKGKPTSMSSTFANDAQYATDGSCADKSKTRFGAPYETCTSSLANWCSWASVIEDCPVLCGKCTDTGGVVPDSSKATDGRKHGSMDSGYCTHTSNTEAGGEWWEVDLATTSKVDKVQIYNRVDGDKDNRKQLNGAEVTLDGVPCGKFSSGWTGNVTCGFNGQHLRITAKEGNNLYLCEVDVFGNPDPSLDSDGITWHYGKGGASCSSTCEALSKTCNNLKLHELAGDDDATKAAFELAGQTCTKVSHGCEADGHCDSWAVPSIWNDGGTCKAGTTEVAYCSVSPADNKHRRLCPCG